MIIYKTINLVNGKFYVGRDIKNNPNYLGSGKILKLAIEKYGKENFKKEILENCKNEYELNEKEIYWIEKLAPPYNIAKGGTGGHTMKYADEKTKEEYSKTMSKATSGEKNGMYGKHQTDETKKKISEHHLNSQEWRNNVVNAGKKKKGIPNKKISVARKKYYELEENRNKTQIAVQKYFDNWSDDERKQWAIRQKLGMEKFKKSDKYDLYVKNMKKTINEIWENADLRKEHSKIVKNGIRQKAAFNFIIKNNINIDEFCKSINDESNLLKLKRKYNAINIQFSKKSILETFNNEQNFKKQFIIYQESLYGNKQNKNQVNSEG